MKKNVYSCSLRRTAGCVLMAALAFQLTSCSGKTAQEVFPEIEFDLGKKYTPEYVFYGDTYLFDTSTGESTFYCFDSSCAHKVDLFAETETTCLALIMGADDAYLTNQHLYFLKYDAWNSAKLIRADQTGGNQEELTTFQNVQSVAYYIYKDNMAYYAFQNTVSDEDGQMGESLDQQKIRIFSVDLSTSEQTLLAEEEGYSLGLIDMWVEDDILCYCVSYMDQLMDYSDLDNTPALDEQLAHAFTDIYQINLKDNTKEQLLSRNASLNYGMVGQLFFYCESDGFTDIGDRFLHILDLRTMEERTDENIELANIYRACGDSVFIAGWHYEDAQLLCDCYLIDPESGEILRSISYENFYPRATFEEGLYYLYTDENGETAEAWVTMDAFWKGKIEEHLNIPG